MIDKIALYRSFAAVARCESISAAAKLLFVTQPAVSSDILELEDVLGVTLFYRTNRGVRLTTEGEVLYEHVRSAFAFLDSGEDAIREMTGLHSGTLRIGASDMTLRFYLLDHIRAFCRRYPQIKLTITNNPTPRTLEALREGSIDFGVISEGDAQAQEGLCCLPVRQIRDIFVCAPTCPLAGQPSVPPKQLQEHGLIMLEKNTSTRRYLRSVEGYESLEADIELATSELIIEFAKRGMGVAAVVEDFAADALQSGALCRIDLEKPLAPRQLQLVYSRRLPLSAAARAMLKTLQESENEPYEATH